MTRTDRRGGRAAIPLDILKTELRSPDAEARVKALHHLCPCAAGFANYERFRDEVRRLQKDPNGHVRAMALHVERDACEIELIQTRMAEAEEQGWRYSDVGWMNKKRRRQASRYYSPL